MNARRATALFAATLAAAAATLAWTRGSPNASAHAGVAPASDPSPVASEPAAIASAATASTPAGQDAPSAKLALFDGKSLAGWKQVLEDPKADPAKTWSVKDSVIHVTGKPAGYIRTEKSFKNYYLVVEWRWPAEAGNSGVLLHMQRDDKVWPYSVEAQLQSGSAGDFWLIGGATAQVDDRRRNPNAANNVKRLSAAEKPLGEWNRYEITCLDGAVILVVNGELMNFARKAVPDEGFICLQSEGVPIEFRKVELTPIP